MFSECYAFAALSELFLRCRSEQESECGKPDPCGHAQKKKSPPGDSISNFMLSVVNRLLESLFTPLQILQRGYQLLRDKRLRVKRPR